MILTFLSYIGKELDNTLVFRELEEWEGPVRIFEYAPWLPAACKSLSPIVSPSHGNRHKAQVTRDAETAHDGAPTRKLAIVSRDRRGLLIDVTQAATLGGQIAVSGVHTESLPNGVATMEYRLHATQSELEQLLQSVRKVEGVQQAFELSTAY